MSGRSDLDAGMRSNAVYGYGDDFESYRLAEEVNSSTSEGNIRRSYKNLNDDENMILDDKTARDLATDLDGSQP